MSIGGHDEREQTLNQILTEMDGLYRAGERGGPLGHVRGGRGDDGAGRPAP